MDHIWDSEEAIFTAYELLARRGFITESGKALTPAGETAVTRLLGMMEGVL